MWLYWFGLIVHIMFIMSASDIFFKNHLGNNEFKCVDRNGTARRVVFIVVEGLDENHLRLKSTGIVEDVIHGDGVWGTARGPNIISEFSGNIALIAGYSVDFITTNFYRYIYGIEEIDNFMNRSSEVFYIGCKRVYDYIYKHKDNKWWTYFNPYFESNLLVNSSYSMYSELAANQLSNIFTKGNSDHSLDRKLNQDKIVFFIYLDSVSKSALLHGYNSSLVNETVDDLFTSINSITNSVENYYKDSKTTFLLFSNFGLKDSYSQSILPQETENKYPFAAWGAGIRYSSQPLSISQLDVAAMVSTLLGTNFPSNSRGTIPSFLLNINREDLDKADACNALQLYSLALEAESRLPYKVAINSKSLEEINEGLNNFLYNTSDAKLTMTPDSVINLSSDKIRKQEYFFKSIIWNCSILLSISWIFLILSEILPYKDTLENKSLISFSELRLRMTSGLNNFNNQVASVIRERIFLNQSRKNNHNIDESSGKILNQAFTNNEEQESARNIEVSENNELQNKRITRRRTLIRWKWIRGLTDILFFLAISIIFLVLFFLEWAPIYFIYFTIPITTIWLLSYSVTDWMIFAREYFCAIWQELLIYSIIFLFASSLIISGFHNSLGLAFGIIMIINSFNYINISSWSIVIIWFSTGYSIFLFGESGLWYSTLPFPMILIPSTIAVILWNVYAAFRLNSKGIDFIITVLLLWQSGMTLGCIIFTDTIQSGGRATPYALKITCWLLVISFIFPAFHGKNHSSLVLNICIALSVPFVLISTAFEPLLYLFLTNFMISWMLLEGYSDIGMTAREHEGSDARRALLFVYFVFYIYKVLGYGCSSITSDVHSIRCFTETLNEPIVRLLLLMKPILIFSMMTAIFLIICSSNGVKENKELHIVLLFYELINIKLFFMIKMNEDGTLPTGSVPIALCYFTMNIFVVILILLLFWCKYIYRIPLSTNV